MKKGEGCKIWDVDGKEYIDFANNMGPLVLGHRNPKAQRAVAEQLDSFWCGSPTELEIELGEKIMKAFPMCDKMLFAISGTEALMKLVRAARASTGRKKIMMATGAYHGTSDSLMPGEGVPQELDRLTLKYSYNDPESFRAVFDENRSDLAAVVTEAVLGSAGSVAPDRAFLQLIREETRKHDVPFILDEVVTGFRVARGGISEKYGVQPDGISLGKIIGGGFPVAAFLATDRLMEPFSYSSAELPFIGKTKIKHAGTFNAFPPGVAAGLATLDQLTPEAYEHLDYLGETVGKSLSKVCEDRHLPHYLTGMSSMFRLHFTSTPIRNYETFSSSWNEKTERLFDAELLQRGIFMPPAHSAFLSTPVGSQELEQFENAAASALDGLNKNR
jgi:glutamate-1-semialdehyde 2,1-aminomutase